jgi:hypothetical protein
MGGLRSAHGTPHATPLPRAGTASAEPRIGDVVRTNWAFRGLECRPGFPGGLWIAPREPPWPQFARVVHGRSLRAAPNALRQPLQQERMRRSLRNVGAERPGAPRAEGCAALAFTATSGQGPRHPARRSRRVAPASTGRGRSHGPADQIPTKAPMSRRRELGRRWCFRGRRDVDRRAPAFVDRGRDRGPAWRRCACAVTSWPHSGHERKVWVLPPRLHGARRGGLRFAHCQGVRRVLVTAEGRL